jgi:GTP-binding protein Era
MENENEKSEEKAVETKSGFVSIVGRPNSGKSTLLNQLVGNKVSIVTPSAQTTRNVVRGIASDSRGQIIFLDTPGIHKPLFKMNERMMRLMLESLKHIEVVMLMVDVTASDGRGEQFARDLVSKVESRKFLLLNKIDRVNKRKLLPMIDKYRTLGEFDEIVPISALKKDGVEELKSLIFNYLSVGPMYYPADQISDRPERFLVAEIIREKLILGTRQELPHATAIAIEKFEEGERLVKIWASVYVERDSQKAIVIGKGGQLMKHVGTRAREDIEALLETKVHLEIHVKVRKKWRDDDHILETLGI